VTATNVATGIAFQTLTNGAGAFSLQQLTLGEYEIAVEAKGFRRAVRRGVELNVAQTRQLDFALEVGQVEQTVEVSAAATALQTATSDLGTTIQRKKLIDLPLFVGGNVRNFDSLFFYRRGLPAMGRTRRFRVFAGKEVLIDGIGATGIESGGVIPGSARPSVETIGEFRLLRANFNAEYGRTWRHTDFYDTVGHERFSRGAVQLFAQRQAGRPGVFPAGPPDRTGRTSLAGRRWAAICRQFCRGSN
jgi:hypothetical protein